MKIQHFVITITILGIVASCKKEYIAQSRIEGSQIGITDSLTPEAPIEEFIKPYRDHIKNDLDSILAYSPVDMSDLDGEFETIIGNMVADMLMEQASPVFEERTGKKIDFCLVNHGGIRADIAKGPVRKRTAYEVLPFENNIVVVELTAEKVGDLITYLSKAKRAHPIAGMTLALNTDYSVREVLIDGAPLDPAKTYNVLTNDYLQNGGDGMLFFKDPIKLHTLDYKVRNALIDYFAKIDSLPVVLDRRFIRIQ